MRQDDKRRFREEKRAIKQAGNKRRRRALKAGLDASTGETPEAVEDLGRHISAELNGNDRRPSEVEEG